jgi:uncharacterized protein (UPF0276 family)
MPSVAGIGLRLPHSAEIAATRPAIGFLEVHAENYLIDAAALDRLLDLRGHYPVSVHGVALSLGSAEPLDTAHLGALRTLIERVEPFLVSEHLAWSAIGGTYLNDLLPLPYTPTSLGLFCDHVDEAQAVLGRQLLIENPAPYFRYRGSSIPEPAFLAEIARRTGCQILCDVNNLHVSARNFGFDPLSYLDRLPAAAIAEIHLAGHHRADLCGVGEARILIDDHAAPVAAPVWDLYAEALRRYGPVPTLIEWDANLPPLATLLAELRHAQGIMTGSAETRADADRACPAL